MLFRQTNLKTCKVAEPAYSVLPDAAPAAVFYGLPLLPIMMPSNLQMQLLPWTDVM